MENTYYTVTNFYLLRKITVTASERKINMKQFKTYLVTNSLCPLKYIDDMGPLYFNTFKMCN